MKYQEEYKSDEIAIFKEFEDIKKSLEELKLDLREKGTVDEDYKEKFTVKSEEEIYSVISGFNSIDVPDIMDEIKILGEIRDKENLDEEDLNYIKEEYTRQINTLTEALLKRKNAMEKMYTVLNRYKF